MTWQTHSGNVLSLGEYKDDEQGRGERVHRDAGSRDKRIRRLEVQGEGRRQRKCLGRPHGLETEGQKHGKSPSRGGAHKKTSTVASYTRFVETGARKPSKFCELQRVGLHSGSVETQTRDTSR